MLDSVIGTFLTQNVSDQLSSKAYMTLAARFPARPPALNPSLHPEHNAPAAAPLPPELPVHGNTDSNCMASSHNADHTAAVHGDKGLANCDDLGVRERQLVVTDGVDISDAVDWEAVRRAPASQVYFFTPACHTGFLHEASLRLCSIMRHAHHLKQLLGSLC